MMRRWDMAEVEGDDVASLCTWDLCEIGCLCEISLFLATPPRPYMGDDVSGSDPSRLQVFANPNYSWASWASSVYLVLGL
jgi:hypothetical protein